MWHYSGNGKLKSVCGLGMNMWGTASCLLNVKKERA